MCWHDEPMSLAVACIIESKLSYKASSNLTISWKHILRAKTTFHFVTLKNRLREGGT